MGNLTADIQQILSTNGPWAWPIIFVLGLILTFVIKTVLRFVAARIRQFTVRTRSRWDDIMVDLVDGLRWEVVLVWCLYLLSHLVEPAGRVQKVLQVLLVIFSVYQIIIWGLYLIRNWRETVLVRHMDRDASSASVLGLMYVGVQSAFLIIVVLIGLSNVGVDIGALVTGLGVGGIAVALAAQNVLGDLLASLSIVLDKPFVIGEFIGVGGDVGTVERIGIKTTRVRSLSGEELVFSNKDLLENRIHNYKKMLTRRIVKKFGVSYSTPPEQLEQIPRWVREFADKYPKLKYDRCHFSNYGDSSLDFELVFIIQDPDYNAYMDLQQGLLLDIMRKFRTEKINFAFPSLSLYMENAQAMLVMPDDNDPGNSAPSNFSFANPQANQGLASGSNPSAPTPGRS